MLFDMPGQQGVQAFGRGAWRVGGCRQDCTRWAVVRKQVYISSPKHGARGACAAAVAVRVHLSHAARADPELGSGLHGLRGGAAGGCVGAFRPQSDYVRVGVVSFGLALVNFG
jgi:hypothetical protein